MAVKDGEIGIYGVLRNDTPEGILAKTDQIKDDNLDLTQKEINRIVDETSEVIGDVKNNTNYFEVNFDELPTNSNDDQEISTALSQGTSNRFISGLQLYEAFAKGKTIIEVGNGAYIGVEILTSNSLYCKTFLLSEDEIGVLKLIDLTWDEHGRFIQCISESYSMKFVVRSDIENNLTSSSRYRVLSANQGRVLNETKQDKLVSGTNIKTINNKSLLGSGNITIDLNVFQAVSELPTQNINASKVYLVPSDTTGEENIYTEYIYVNDNWEILGQYKSNVDLSGYKTLEGCPTVVMTALQDYKYTANNVTQTQVFTNAFNTNSPNYDTVADKVLNAATSTTAGVMSAADKTKLDNSAAQTDLTALETRVETNESKLTNHIDDTDNPHEVTKSQIGLSNVDNTSDVNKPISTATQTALNNKVDKTTTINGHVLSGNVTVTKADVGLSNVDNTSDTNKPVSTAQQAAINSAKSTIDTYTVNGKEISDSPTINAGDVPITDTLGYFDSTNVEDALQEIKQPLDTHLSNQTPGMKHIPSGGTANQILAWSANGTAKWENLSNIEVSTEDMLAYGVEWDITVSDPILTRIGNTSLHKSLPIQSGMYGCICQGSTIRYRLDDNDWRYKREPDSTQVTLTVQDSVIKITADAFSTLQYDKQWIKINDIEIQIASIDTDSATATLVSNEYTGTLHDGTFTCELGSVRNGYDGTVKVYVPGFYIKSVSEGNIRRVWLSTSQVDSTYHYQQPVLVDAYRCTVLNTVPQNMGYLSTLPANTAVSIANTNTYCRGGNNNSSYDQYLENDPRRTQLGKPRTNLSRATMRGYAGNADAHLLSYEEYKNIFYWLYVVEYANFNSQATFSSSLDDNGYATGLCIYMYYYCIGFNK